MTMQLRVLLPTEIFLDQTVLKVIAEAENGLFCLEPRHVDFVTVLVPGLLIYHDESNQERIAAVDHGILVKAGEEVLISTHNAVLGDDLTTLRSSVVATFRQLDEHQRVTRSALARLEAGVARRFIELQHEGL
ncbi:MAG: F0F1 ATP synthase subunit epsilon [Pseudomonadota bacterium]|nr:F0F1 ATP synthase subunit epsilon [Pseudomonadota bacterium]